MNKNLDLGKNIKYLREKRELTQEQLGDELGYSGQTISNWENVVKVPRRKTLKKLAQFFQIEVIQLTSKQMFESELLMPLTESQLEIARMIIPNNTQTEMRLDIARMIDPNASPEELERLKAAIVTFHAKYG
ncbi:helix-turn-helix domain-containing protein [Periweissella cryptocerci]|uniref:Helix-turn-helix domain-containing protein n=1 Tax=Periweissella cryptocerci TaxID=2506420 RepID=A0A4P6YX14_9LACO|nr:helix-turn-helix domain-containing protein [Periweissella cryptocerci]QBO37398.1 helix-turn-helix domain-containing protein [Periweissella cryptocerci]